MAFSMSRARKMTAEQRFLEKVEKTDSCWLWAASSRNEKGYGAFYWGPTQKDRGAAHRWAYMHFVGPIPEGLYVCHKCDNPRCVNPEHLFLGTAADNARDMAKKGRSPSQGKPNRRAAKLTLEQVHLIREMYQRQMSYGEIAVFFGVTRQNIGYICRGKTWA